jgi:DNA repair exonuclease SbcCD nuclease subunit
VKRIALVGDSHFDESSRFEECIRVHRWIADDIERRSGDPETAIDLLVHSGDVYERKSTPRERLAAASFFQAVSGSCPTLIVRGNHDAEEDLALLAHLEPNGPSYLHRITVEERARVHSIAGIAIAAVAWPKKAALLAATGVTSKEGGEQAAGDALRNVLRGLGATLAEHDAPRLLVMHAMVRNSVTSTGQPLVGMDMEIGLEDLALVGADAYALGHIHKGQHWTIGGGQHGGMAEHVDFHGAPGGAPVIYPGSPRRTAFGELEPKGYVIIEIEDAEDGDSVHAAGRKENGRVTWTFVETPATPMVHILANWTTSESPDDEDGTPRLYRHPENPDVAGAEVRLRYVVASDARDAAKRAAIEYRDELLARGAVSVKLEEEVLATTRARAPEVAAAKTLPEKLTALRASRGEVLTDERRERLEGKLAVLEQEIAS